MEIIQVNQSNLQSQHICCAISKTPDAQKCAAAKKGWMEQRFAEGYEFWKLDAQGKVLIEFIPAKNAWCPIQADGWLFIDCFWVSGQYKGKGYANALFQKAVDAAKQQSLKGIVALSGNKKQPFLSDPGFYKHKGFVEADTAPPHYVLLALPFKEGAPLPKFNNTVKQPQVSDNGFVVYYTNHCPHTSKFVPLLQEVAQNRGLPFTAVEITTTKQAQSAPNPFTAYAMFYNGQFVANEIFSEPKMNKFIDALQAP